MKQPFASWWARDASFNALCQEYREVIKLLDRFETEVKRFTQLRASTEVMRLTHLRATVSTARINVCFWHKADIPMC